MYFETSHGTLHAIHTPQLYTYTMQLMPLSTVVYTKDECTAGSSPVRAWNLIIYVYCDTITITATLRESWEGDVLATLLRFYTEDVSGRGSVEL